MKKLNKKGFTLIELLAVIVILAILVTVSVPAVTKYLGTARKGTFVTNAQTAISAVRNDVIINGGISKVYTFAEVDAMMESGKGFVKSPYGKEYDKTTSFVRVVFDVSDNTTTYSVCLRDSGGAGIAETLETALDDSDVKTSGITCDSTTPLASE